MKKIFTAVIVTMIVWCMIITSSAWAQTVNELKLGDADGDGKTDINDALAVALYDCGMKIQNDMAGFTMADADCSGKVDIFDALKIAEFDAGTVKTLECSGCIQPSVPGGLGAFETEDMTSVSISWNAVPWAESYRLYRDTSSEGSFTEEIYTGSDTSYTESADSDCGTSCYYRVLAENTCGQSAKSDYASVESYSACYALSSPGGLRASPTGQTSVKINWNFVGLASSYRLYRDTSATGSFSSKIYEGTANSYTNTNLQCGTIYCYRVAAVNSCSQQSPKSALVWAKTFLCCNMPSIPGGLSAGVRAAAAGAASVNISWSAVSWATGYRLYKDTSATGSFTKEIYSGAGTSYTDSTGLNCGTSYYYKVFAENSCGQSAKSDYVSAAYSSPSAPAVMETSKTPGSVNVSWSAVSAVVSYLLYRDTSETGSFTRLIYSGPNTSYIDNDIDNCGKSYYYKVAAENACGQSPPTYASLNLYLCCTGKPSLPNGLTLLPSPGWNSLKISWDASSDDPAISGTVSSYSLYRDTSIVGSFSQMVYSGSDTSYTDTNLQCGIAYYYKVLAKSECGESEKSGCLIAVPNQCVKDNNNGTVIINEVVWLKNFNCLGSGDYATAKSKIAGLKSDMCGLTDNSAAGEWRLPTKDELLTVYNKYKSAFSPGEYDLLDSYWSSTLSGYGLRIAVGMRAGLILEMFESNPYNRFWPVRSIRPGE